MYKIVKKENLNPTVTKMVIDAPLVAAKVEPGQFIILRVDENGERIPLTVADYDRKGGTVTIIFQIVGATTEKLNALSEGEYIRDFVGPLGRATETEGRKKVAVIGGGHVGLEVAHYLCADNKVTVVEMQKEVGASIYRTAKYKLLALLGEAGVEILTQHAIAGVKEGAAVLKKMDTGEEVEIAADVVVMALGNRPDTAYIDSVASVCEKTVVIGDAVSAGTMADATRAAYEKCFCI